MATKDSAKLTTPSGIEIKDSRLERVKIIPLSTELLGMFLQQDGTYAVKVEGWPEGAELVGFVPLRAKGHIGLMLHRGDFPLVVDRAHIPVLEVKAYIPEGVEVVDMNQPVEDSANLWKMLHRLANSVPGAIDVGLQPAIVDDEVKVQDAPTEG